MNSQSVEMERRGEQSISGSAVIAKAMGEGKEDKAKQYFPMLTCVEVLFGIFFAVFGNLFMNQIFYVLGVSAIQYDLAAAVSGLVFFCINKNGLHFCKFRFEKDILLKVCGNGSSEMVTNLANAVTTFLFNYTFMKYFGEDGVASISILIYFQYIFTAIYFGYSNGISPIVSVTSSHD